MKCKYCGKKLKRCYIGNPDCKVKRHWMHDGCVDCVGIGGVHDPCWELKVGLKNNKI